MVEPPMDSGPGGGEPTITLVTPGAAALASFNASNDVECARDPALIETAINSSSFTSKAKRDDEKRIAEGKTGDAVKRAQLRARARVAEEKRKVESRLAKKNWDDDTTTSTSRNVLKEKIRLNVQNKDKTVNAAKSKMKNGLEMVSHVMIPYETTKENRDTIQKNGIDIGATCICSLPNSLSVACGRENGCVDIGFAKGELNVQRRMNPSVPQQRLEMNRICEKVAKKSGVKSMRLNEDVLAIGFDNGAFVKIVEPGCFEERGLTQETCVLRAHEAPKEVQDIFKRVAGGKLLGPHVSRKANCRAQVISKDLEVLFFGSPVFRDGSFFATREVYKNRMRRRKKKKNREEEGASKKTLIRKGFLNNTCSSTTQIQSPSVTIEEVDDDDFTLTRSFDKFETASEMNEMYDILLSDMSEKEQMEALNTPYRKKKPKARVNEKSLTDVTKNASAEVSVSDEKEKEEEEEEGQEEGQEEEEPTVVTYRFSAHAHPVQSLAYYDEDNETTLISGSNDRTVAFWDLEKTFDEEDFPDVLPSPMFKFHAGTEVRAMVVSKSKRVLYLAGADKCVHMFELLSETTNSDIPSGAMKKRTFPCHHEGFITTLSLSQDNMRLFTGSEYSDTPDDGFSKNYNSGDGTICVWDVSTGEATDVVRAHNGTITQILVNDDDNETIHTSALDGCVHRMKRTEHGKLRLNFEDGRRTTRKPTFGFRKGFL
tara:strand:- start:1122 stop:3257 length:2136 start_codon:yes stop_codon:yes gene_type:complete